MINIVPLRQMPNVKVQLIFNLTTLSMLFWLWRGTYFKKQCSPPLGVGGFRIIMIICRLYKPIAEMRIIKSSVHDHHTVCLSNCCFPVVVLYVSKFIGRNTVYLIKIILEFTFIVQQVHFARKQHLECETVTQVDHVRLFLCAVTRRLL